MRYLAGFFIGVLLASLFMMREPVSVHVPVVKIHREVSVDYDTVPKLQVDTLYLDTTQYEIPIFEYTFAESLPFYVNNDLRQLSFDLKVKGYVKSYDFETRNTDFTVRSQSENRYKIGCVASFGVVCLLLYLLVKG